MVEHGAKEREFVVTHHPFIERRELPDQIWSDCRSEHVRFMLN
ncbi:MAG TPA: hypothetical protein VK604_03035 [Bryobacteraceae bacterium]|nr:hypothetical protein [Bryobacteraceae bacterium]